MTDEVELPESHVLRYIDRDEFDLILYDPKVAERAKEILNLAESVSTWGDLRRFLVTTSPELVDPILASLWDQWNDGPWEFGFGFDEDDPDIPTIRDRDALLTAFPDERPLTVTTTDEDGPIFMDPFDPVAMGVPEELRGYYVEQSGTLSVWNAPKADDLAEIRQVVEELGWKLEEGNYGEIPHFA
jgi:hypothetical protein